jgi:DNA-binding NarL/FixJ family response regulator
MPDEGPPRVLVVDDVPEMRRMLSTVLGLKGLRVVGEAEDGRNAVELAAELQPDVVILDLGLPDLEGRDVLTGIRNHAPQCRVVIFSGVRVDDTAELETRVEGYVGKEQELEILLDAVEAAVHRPVQVVTRSFPRMLESVARARTMTARALTDWGMGHLAGDGLVVVSELATNAVLHARTPFELRLSSHPRSFRIAVLDHGPGTPEPLAPSGVRPHGRGLQIVDAMASAWGVSGLKEGTKLVWAELPAKTRTT